MVCSVWSCTLTFLHIHPLLFSHWSGDPPASLWLATNWKALIMSGMCSADSDEWWSRSARPPACPPTVNLRSSRRQLSFSVNAPHPDRTVGSRPEGWGGQNRRLCTEKKKKKVFSSSLWSEEAADERLNEVDEERWSPHERWFTSDSLQLWCWVTSKKRTSDENSFCLTFCILERLKKSF